MSYPTKLSDAAAELLQPFVEKLLELAAGESIVFTDTPANLNIFRNHLYTWRHVNQLQQHFKLFREGPTRIRVMKRAAPRPRILETLEFSSVEKFVMDELLEILTEEHALELIRKGIDEGKLRASDSFAILTEWRRIQGKDAGAE